MDLRFDYEEKGLASKIKKKNIIIFIIASIMAINRNQSEDSRYPSIGIISKKEIIGKAFLRVSTTFNIIDMLSIPKEDKNGETN